MRSSSPESRTERTKDGSVSDLDAFKKALEIVSERARQSLAAQERTDQPERTPHVRLGSEERERDRLAWMMGQDGGKGFSTQRATFRLDGKGDWLGGDPAWLDATGMSDATCQGEHWVEAFDPASYASLHESFVALISKREPFWKETEFVDGVGGFRSAFLDLRHADESEELLGQVYFGEAPLQARLTLSSKPSESDGRLWKLLGGAVVGSLATALILAVAGMAIFAWSERHADASDLSITDSATDVSASEEARAAELVLRNYHASEDLAGRATWVDRGPSLLPQMTAFYTEKGHFGGSVETIRRWDIVSLHGRRHYVAQGMDHLGERFLTLVDLEGATPKVNWEASVGYSDIPLKTFLEARPTSPTLMRLLIRPDDYYNHGYSDSRTYASFEVCDVEDTSPTHVYVERRSPTFIQLMDLFPDYASQANRPLRTLAPAGLDRDDRPLMRRVTLKLAYDSSDETNAQIRIAEVLGEEWVVAMQSDD